MSNYPPLDCWSCLSQQMRRKKDEVGLEYYQCQVCGATACPPGPVVATRFTPASRKKGRKIVSDEIET